jgi:hypothetical protein
MIGLTLHTAIARLQDAQGFIELLLSAAGQRTLLRHGFPSAATYP